jgi:hypothetical protein
MSSTAIAIPQPCHERWAAMLPTATGRHCASCQESVVDFTRMSDAEVIEFLERYPAVSCGRFRDEQLDRQLWPPATGAPAGWRQWLATLATVVGLTQLMAPRAAAQEILSNGSGGPTPGSKSQTEVAVMPKSSPTPELPAAPALPPTQELVIRGVVRSIWGIPLASAWVRIEGTTLTTRTDAHGRFLLRIASSELPEETGLRISHLGHARKRVELDLKQSGRYHVFLKRASRIISGKFR